MIDIAFVVAAFVAGLFMFLAPCTLPLVPAYLAFISGIKRKDIQNRKDAKKIKLQIMKNSTAFVLGFTSIFILMGVLVGLVGTFFIQYRIVIAQIGGIFVIILGLLMLGVINIGILSQTKTSRLPKFIRSGNPVSGFLVGVSFATGWSPCVGPVLASILLLASSSTTAAEGGLLLLVFSFGLAIPFLLVALLFTKAERFIFQISFLSKLLSYVGGVFLIILGLLLATNNFALTYQVGFEIFDFFNYERILDYL